MSKFTDLSPRVFIISTVLTILLAISNTYLALKVGLLTAASIPAAILSMGIMKFLRKSTVFEHNLVQTAASSGEAVAGGIVYTIPALIVIGFWQHFPYWENVLIALLSGVLGVFFSALVRRPLLADPSLPFPEGRAIAEVLRLKEARVLGFREMLFGSAIAALFEFGQSTGLLLGSISKFVVKSGVLFGFGISFAPALVGAGFIIGIRVGLSLLLGALISYLILLPMISHGHIDMIKDPLGLFSQEFSSSICYIGIGAMLVAALLTLFQLIKPIAQKVGATVQELANKIDTPAHEQGLSIKTIIGGSLLALALLYPTLAQLFSLSSTGLALIGISSIIVGSLVYIVIVGFIAVIICGYFSGLVGVSASPGSSIIIAGMIFAALLTHAVFLSYFKIMTESILIHGEAITIIVGGIVTGIACIANDTIQDLKVGQMLRASPRKQQLMLLFGVLISALVVPLVMELLYQAYGFAGHLPRSNMDPNNALAIPPAAMMAALTQGIFNGAVPWHDICIGAATMLILFVLNEFVCKRLRFELSLLGVGIGMYLPLSNSSALIIGSLTALALTACLRKKEASAKTISAQKKLLLACGLVTGATLMDVILAIPIALNPSGSPLSFHIAAPISLTLGSIAAFILLIALGFERQ